MLKKIVSSEKSEGYALGSVAYAIGNSKQPIEGAADMLKKIVSSEKADGDTLGSVVFAIGDTRSNPSKGRLTCSKKSSRPKKLTVGL